MAKPPVTANPPRPDASPLFDMLEEKLFSCLDINGSVNQSELARRTGFSRQQVFEVLASGFLSPPLAYYMLERLGDQITIDDVRPFVRRPSRKRNRNKA